MYLSTKRANLFFETLEILRTSLVDFSAAQGAGSEVVVDLEVGENRRLRLDDLHVDVLISQTVLAWRVF